MKVTTDSCLFGAWVASEIENQESAIKNILDIGTGTGLLSLMIAQKNQLTKIDAVEIDEAAASQAVQNVLSSSWAKMIAVHHADIKNYIDNQKEKYDHIVCNPPFYENELASPDKNRSIAHHSESISLREIIKTISAGLKSNGQFYLLLPFKRLEDVKYFTKENSLDIAEIILVRQTRTHPFFRIMVRGYNGYNTDNNFSTNEIAIKKEQGNYTDEFISLLKQYYLYL